MLDATTINKLHEMKLGVMAESFLQQSKELDRYAQLSFEERFGFLVDEQWAHRKSNRINRCIQHAQFRYPNACMEGIDYFADRNLDQSLLLRLATGAYIADHRDILLLGPTGCGKTFISNALGICACRKGYAVRYIRLPELLDDFVLAREMNTFRKVMSRYQKYALLILDEWLLTSLDEMQTRDLLELLEIRCTDSSTIFCSQFSPLGWHGKLGDGALADSVLDRIIHNAYKMEIQGKSSMRERYGIPKDS